MTDTKIKELYRKFHVPVHVAAHMERVKEIAELLCNALISQGLKIDKKAVIQAALLHDVLRVCDFREPQKLKLFQQKITSFDLKTWQKIRKKYGQKGHIKAMVEILNKMGEPYLANLVLKHDFWLVAKLKTWEEKIIFYADKRVESAKLVSLKTRFLEGKRRNAKASDSAKSRTKTENQILALEKEFIKVLGRLPI